MKEILIFIRQLMRSRARKKDKDNKRNLPLMKWKEIDILLETLKNLQPPRCLEWGSGYSTLYYPDLIIGLESWDAIEHHKDWYQKIKEKNENSRARLHLVEPNNEPWTDENNDGSYSDLKDYVEFPDRLGGKFDFILIDGRARSDCLRKAFSLINNDGIVALHDARRTYYHKNFYLFKHQVLFQDTRRNRGGLWLGTKDLDLHKVLNIKKHESVWKIHDWVEKKLRMRI